MHAGIEILIERMKTHPEEFYRASRWSSLVSDFAKFLSEDDRKAFEHGIAECRKQELTEIIMDRIVNEDKEDKEILNRLNAAKAIHGVSTSRVVYNPETDQHQVRNISGNTSQMQEYNNAQNSALNQFAQSQSYQLAQKMAESLENVKEVKSPSLMQGLKKAFF